MNYRAYGLILDSQEPLAELEPSSDQTPVGETDVWLELCDALPNPATIEPGWSEFEDAWPLIQREGAGYRLSFDEDSVFWVAEDGRTIRCFAGAIPTHTRNHYLLDHVLPRALHLMGKNPLHATAVATGVGVLAFVGETGMGKSTIAAAFASLGSSLVSDDCLVLHEQDGCMLAVPSYSGLRLYADVSETLFQRVPSTQVAHYSSKQRITTELPLAGEPQVLRGVFALARVPDLDRAVLQRLGPADATMALATGAFRMDLEHARLHREQLRFFAAVARVVPVWSCQVPDDLSKLLGVAPAIIEAVRSQSERP